MLHRRGLGALGIVCVVATAVFGFSGFARTHVLEIAPGARLAATLSALALVTLVVIALVSAGWSARQQSNTAYW